jgi:hypothetical protein
MKPQASLTLALAAIATAALAQPRGGVLRGKIVNGTTGGPGRAERVALVKMQSGMEPIGALGEVSGSFVLENLSISGETLYLLQVTADGVNYNQPVRFGRGYEAEATVTVYSVTSQWKDIEVSRARFVFRREQHDLRVDKLFVVENKTEPKKTYFRPEGTFNFHLPPDLKELISVSAASPGGVPVPQVAQPLADGSGYIARTALKPGTTQIGISYRVDYAKGTYAFKDRASYPVSDFMALFSPLDIQVEAAGLVPMGADPQNRFITFGARNVSAGTPIELRLSGGGEAASNLVSGSTGSGSQGPNRATRTGTLPDPYRSEKWIIVLLMAAALSYGLVASLISTPAGEPATALDKKAGHRERKATAARTSSRKVPQRRAVLELNTGASAGDRTSYPCTRPFTGSVRNRST